MKTVKNMIYIIFIFSISVFFLACKKASTSFEMIEGYNDGLSYIVNESLYSVKADNPMTDDEEDFVNSDLNDFKTQNTAYIEFEDDQAIINNPVANTDIYLESGKLIVDSTQKLTLVLKGTFNGGIQINKPDGKLKLVLDGVEIHSDLGPAINLQTEKRVFLIINDGTINELSDGNQHPLMSNGSSTKAAIFSEEQIIISGRGELNINANYKHAIASDDYIKIIDGNINILSSVSDGLRANDYIVIDGGTINIQASGDGIECEKGFIAINGGKISIHADKNGIKAEYDEDLMIDPWIEINSGITNIDALEKGIVSKSAIKLNDGALMISSQGDAISAEKNVTIFNGIYFLNSLEKQAIDGNLGVLFLGGQTLLFSDGNEVVAKSNQGTIEIQEGTVLMAGAIDLQLTSTYQGYLKCGSVKDFEIIDIRDDESIETIAFLKEYNHVIFSSPNIQKNNSYDIYNGGSITGHNFYGYFISGSYSGGVFKNSVNS